MPHRTKYESTRTLYESARVRNVTLPISRTTPAPTQKRVPLSRARVLSGALAVADAGGADALTIRSLAEHLGVKPMAIYYHVANKREILDGILDLVFGEIELPGPRRRLADRDGSAERTRPATCCGATRGRSRCCSRDRPGPATLRHHDAVIGTLRGRPASR